LLRSAAVVALCDIVALSFNPLNTFIPYLYLPFIFTSIKKNSSTLICTGLLTLLFGWFTFSFRTVSMYFLKLARMENPRALTPLSHANLNVKSNCGMGSALPVFPVLLRNDFMIINDYLF
jgi:hypothetical protein